MDNISALGFNGEYLDDILNSYHLGNGYRAYNPTTMQFTAPDDMSPFGKGGVNPYVYVSCDPINNTDPTGHFLGLTFSLAGAIALFNMVSPVQAPTTASLPGVEEALINTGINAGAEVVMPGVGEGVAIAAEHALVAPGLATMDEGLRAIIDNAIKETREDIEQEATRIVYTRPVYNIPANEVNHHFFEIMNHNNNVLQQRALLFKTESNMFNYGSELKNAEDKFSEAKADYVQNNNDRRYWINNTHEFWAPSSADRAYIATDSSKVIQNPHFSGGRFYSTKKNLYTHVTERKGDWNIYGKPHYPKGPVWGGYPRRLVVYSRALQ